ncbi:unnamed protein product [Ectocarpus sp. 13 AM-2016]
MSVLLCIFFFRGLHPFTFLNFRRLHSFVHCCRVPPVSYVLRWLSFSLPCLCRETLVISCVLQFLAHGSLPLGALLVRWQLGTTHTPTCSRTTYCGSIPAIRIRTCRLDLHKPPGMKSDNGVFGAMLFGHEGMGRS